MIFLSCIVKWVPRNCNKVVDMLSKIASANECELYFNLDFSSEIQNIVIFDSC